MPTDEEGRTRSDIVRAFATRGDLRLDDAERARLEDYVVDAWGMADRLRAVPVPGIDDAARLPRRAAYASRGPAPRADTDVRIGTGALGSDGRSSDEQRAARLASAGLVDAARALARGEATAVDLVDAVLDRIARFDGALRSCIAVSRDGSRARAKAADAERATGDARGLLDGIPIGAKDNIPVAGFPCTYNSPLTRDWWPARDAECMRRLRAAGAIVVAKHNLNEFGWSIPSEDDLHAPPRNPWRPDAYAVGSSSGGGVAVAAHMAYAAIGTDGGGSTRLPAGQEALYGLKPGHRRVPPDGVTEGHISEVGILARRAEDVAAVFATLLVDPDDPDARARRIDEPGRAVAGLADTSTRVRIGVPESYVAEVGMSDDVRAVFEATVRTATSLGFDVVPVADRHQRHLGDARRANFVVLAAEHYFDHEETGKDRGRYGPSAGFYNLPGACLTAADYLHGLRVGALVREAVDAALDDADVLLTPTSTVTSTLAARDPETHRRGGNAAYTSPFNISGHAALSFPAGFAPDGWPIGMQLVGRHDGELELLRVGAILARALDGQRTLDVAAAARHVGG